MEWLKNSAELEKPLISTCGDVVEALVDELIPQIKLAAYENEGFADIECKINITFKDDTFELVTEGFVDFPARLIRVKAEKEPEDE